MKPCKSLAGLTCILWIVAPPAISVMDAALVSSAHAGPLPEDWWGTGVADISVDGGGNGGRTFARGGTVTVRVTLHSDYWCSAGLSVGCPGATVDVLVNGQHVTAPDPNTNWWQAPSPELWFSESNPTPTRKGERVWVQIPGYGESTTSTVVFTLEPNYVAGFETYETADGRTAWYGPFVALNHASWAELIGIEVVAPPYLLKTAVEGGNGSVTPNGGLYDEGTPVELRATPDAGYQVKAWQNTDNDTSTAATNTVTMSADKTVKVEFEEKGTSVTPLDGATGPCASAPVAAALPLLLGMAAMRQRRQR
ncbi:MAG: hypothetical protein JXQ73_10010 [Phycisphaerae bacterium]|nr:hypothetical protein [Phycisphaerae bacterium]